MPFAAAHGNYALTFGPPGNENSFTLGLTLSENPNDATEQLLTISGPGGKVVATFHKNGGLLGSHFLDDAALQKLRDEGKASFDPLASHDPASVARPLTQDEINAGAKPNPGPFGGMTLEAARQAEVRAGQVNTSQLKVDQIAAETGVAPALQPDNTMGSDKAMVDPANPQTAARAAGGAEMQAAAEQERREANERAGAPDPSDRTPNQNRQPADSEDDEKNSTPNKKRR